MTTTDQFFALRRIDRNYYESTLYKRREAAQAAANTRRGHDVVALVPADVADKYRDQVRDTCARAEKAEDGLDSYAKTIALLEKIDGRIVGVLMRLDERGRNSRSFGSHADAYEIAARWLREAMNGGTEATPSPASMPQTGGEA